MLYDIGNTVYAWLSSVFLIVADKLSVFDCIYLGFTVYQQCKEGRALQRLIQLLCLFENNDTKLAYVPSVCVYIYWTLETNNMQKTKQVSTSGSDDLMVCEALKQCFWVIFRES